VVLVVFHIITIITQIGSSIQRLYN